MGDKKLTEKGVDYEFDFQFSPSYSILNIHLQNGQVINAEAGAMIYHDTTIGIKTKKFSKGFWKSIIKSLAGESFWINEFTAETGDGLLGLAPPYPGDIKHIKINAGEQWMVYSGAFIACSPSIDTSTKFSGFKKGLFGGENMFYLLVEAEKDSDLFVSALGGFLTRELKAEDTLRIDNSHLVAMQKDVQWDIKKVGGLKSTLFSKEGLVIEVTGPGKIIFQTRSPAEIISWIYRYLPKGRG
ncbi:MAG: TIGR00266 family protein [Candidatus Lokiarchaeota archaeon]|nr:TIGR00266 family protein [Candidatus Lokiarchaeota archaeon]